MSEVINGNRLSRLQILVVVLCSLVAVQDGFDNIAMAFAAAPVARELGLDISTFGAVFGVGSFGIMVGSLVFGSLADWAGRKPMIIMSLLVIGLFSLLTTVVETLPQLLVVRFLAGVGIGGVMPNIIALTAEYSPRQWRATSVTLMFCGVPVGAMLAGTLSAGIVEHWGWRVVFYIGGVIPFISAPILALYLPESLSFLSLRRASVDRSIAILRRIDPKVSYGDNSRWIPVDAPETRRVGPKGLFANGRAVVTPLLWLIFFCNLLVWFFLTNWLPSILQRAHFPADRAALASVVLYAGGLVGGLALGHMVDRRVSYGMLALIYGLGAACVSSIGVIAGAHSPVLNVVIFSAGFLVCGAQYVNNALATNFYPTEMRSTGVGWALGVGRIGSIVGPGIGGALIALQWDVEQLIGVIGIPSLVAAVAMLLIGWNASVQRRPLAEE